MTRVHIGLVAAAILAGGVLTPVPGWAQPNPSADQIVKSLSPVEGLSPTTRGIRVAPSQAGAAAAKAPSVSLNVLFATGSAELTPEAQHALDALGRALTTAQLNAYRFRIEGHTDTVGAAELNQALSERRAASVVAYLEGAYHIDANRLQAVGMGEHDLLVPTPDETPEAGNRRVLVVNIGS